MATNWPVMGCRTGWSFFLGCTTLNSHPVQIKVVENTVRLHCVENCTPFFALQVSVATWCTGRVCFGKGRTGAVYFNVVVYHGAYSQSCAVREVDQHYTHTHIWHMFPAPATLPGKYFTCLFFTIYLERYFAYERLPTAYTPPHPIPTRLLSGLPLGLPGLDLFAPGGQLGHLTLEVGLVFLQLTDLKIVISISTIAMWCGRDESGGGGGEGVSFVP